MLRRELLNDLDRGRLEMKVKHISHTVARTEVPE